MISQRTILGAIGALTLACSGAYAQGSPETFTVAVGQRGVFENSVSELGQAAGIFEKHNLKLEVIYTQGGGETQQAVISGSADIGVGVGMHGVLGAFSKGAPIRVIGGARTGAGDLFWYVPASSPLTDIKEAQGRTIAYSTQGSSTQTVVLAMQEQLGVQFSPVATGSPSSTYTQTMSGQIDIGWSAPPIAVEAASNNEVRILVRGSDVPKFSDQTVRVLIANARGLEENRDALARYLDGYRETLDWLYSDDPAAMKAYAEWSGVSEEIARLTRDDFSTREAVSPDNISGLDALMADAVTFKFIDELLTDEQQQMLIQIPSSTP